MKHAIQTILIFALLGLMPPVKPAHAQRPTDLPNHAKRADMDNETAQNNPGAKVEEEKAKPQNDSGRLAHYGLWQGTIGTKGVMVLLSPETRLCKGDGGSNYYYKKHLWTIGLAEEDTKGKVWTESAGTDLEAKWTFSELSQDGKTLKGEWTSGKGGRSLPIRLNLLALMPVNDHDGSPQYDCEAHNKAFDAPRIARVQQEKKVKKVTNDQQVLSFLGGHIKRFDLSDYSRHPNLKKMLEDWDRKNISSFYNCARIVRVVSPDENLDKFYKNIWFDRILSSDLLNSKILILKETRADWCGGPYPNNGWADYLLWDMKTDNRIDLSKWIKKTDTSVDQIKIENISEDLNRLLFSLYDKYGSCSNDDIWDNVSSFVIYPKNSGMVFSPPLPHFLGPCQADIEIPWHQMQPFLTPIGKSGLSTYFPAAKQRQK